MDCKNRIGFWFLFFFLFLFQTLTHERNGQEKKEGEGYYETDSLYGPGIYVGGGGGGCTGVGGRS